MQELAGKVAFVTGGASGMGLAMERAFAAAGMHVAVLATDVPADARAERINELLANALDPDVVADMVIHAIRTDEFYIFTHPELHEFTDARSAEIAQSFARWSEYRDQHGVSA